jgi:hypothetical protein
VGNFVCENVFQFTVTFHVQVTKTTSTGSTVIQVPVTVGQSPGDQVSDEFSIKGTGIEADITSSAVTADELRGGKLVAMEIAVTVISDYGIDQLRNRTFTAVEQADFLAKNSYQYTKLVQLPSM